MIAVEPELQLDKRANIGAFARLASRAIRLVLFPCILLLTACGPTDIIGGIGDAVNFDPLGGLGCGRDRWDGTWQGTAVSAQNPGGVIDLNVRVVDDCEALVGVAAFASCVPVTEIRGQSESFGFNIVTIDGALAVHTELFFDADFDFGAPAPVGTRLGGTYMFINTQNVPNCPASDGGSVVLEKIG